MTRYVYRGPYAVLEVDGVRLERDGEPVELTAEQYALVQDRDLEAVDGKGRPTRRRRGSPA